jgi:hypothetical protein
MLEFVIVYYPIPSVVALFLCVAAILLLSFLGYQLHLIASGRTTYESFRWRELHKQLLAQAEREEAERAGAGAGAPGGGSARPGWLRRALGRLGLRRRPGAAARVQLPPNVYHKGWRRNLYEVMFPEAALAAASERARKRE